MKKGEPKVGRARREQRGKKENERLEKGKRRENSMNEKRTRERKSLERKGGIKGRKVQNEQEEKKWVQT